MRTDAIGRRVRVWAVSAGILGALSLPALAADADGDGMSDEYEVFYGLNYTNAADVANDNDSDGVTNLQEYALGTDPFAADTDRDGFNDGQDSNALSRIYIQWGDPSFTTSNQYDCAYGQPAWCLGAYAFSGEWATNPPAWHVAASESNGVGSLTIDVDRSILTNDVVMAVDFFSHANGSLYVNLVDSNSAVVATNLFDNLASQSNCEVQTLVDIPFEVHPDAMGIVIRRGMGEVTVYTNRLYVDKDHDGLDADQEKQLGTSDNNADSDGDGLSDYAEVFTYGTDPAKADTDRDGMPDGWEAQYGLLPLANDAASDKDGDGANNLDEYLQGRDPTKGAIVDEAGAVGLKVYTVLE